MTSERNLPGDFVGNLVYVAFVLLATTLLIAFLAIKITPTLVAIMDDLHVEAPAAFRRGITVLAAFGRVVVVGGVGRCGRCVSSVQRTAAAILEPLLVGATVPAVVRQPEGRRAPESQYRG